MTLWVALVAALCAAPTAAAGDRDAPAVGAAKPKGEGKKGKTGEGRAPKELRQLERAGCTPYRSILQGKYSSKQRRAAKRWRFTVFHFETRLKPPVNWKDLDPFKSRSFRQNLHGLTWIDTLLYAYKRTGDETMLRRARDLALDWIESNPRRFRPGRHGFAWHAKSAADRATYLGFLARTAACKGLLNPEQARVMVRSLRAHAEYLADAGEHQVSNFGLFQDLGLLILSRYVSYEKQAAKWRQLALRRFPETLRGRLSSEDVWLEHSTQYQFLAIRLLRDFIKYTPGKPNPELRPTLAAMKAAANWFVKPGGQYALLGDTQIGSAPDWGYNSAADPRGLKPFTESGFAMVRDGGSYLATTSGFFNLTHKHADELDFDLVDHGVQVVNGPGNYGYDRYAEFRDYQLSSQAHSVLVVDGQSFPLDLAKTHGSAIRATGQGAGWYAIEATNPLVADLGVAHSRLFLYRPGSTLAVVDRVRADAPHRYERYFQLGADIEATALNRGMLRLGGPNFAGGLHDAAAGAGEALRLMVRGRRTPLQGFVFPGFRQLVPRWSVDFATHAADADYIATFSLAGPHRVGEVVAAAGNNTRVELTVPGGSTERLSVTRDGRRLSVARLP
ncbi:MAG TPA: heparinase II/III family protein [Solirubrobacterales bacterium]|nr:heparinase II/III family protein [Solirubrobacterales bacterium]